MAAKREAPRELPNAVMEDILLRLDAGADVVRASAISRAYRRVSCDFAFLRRVRVRPPHPPPLLGAFDAKPLGLGDSGAGAGRSHFHPAAPRHPSVSAALAVTRAADMAFSFLPDGPAAGPWRVRDVRDGRVLLSRPRAAATAGSKNSVDLVVCDPLHRRYVQIPPIPDGLADAPRRYGVLELEVFLTPATGDESPLQVMCNAISVWKMETIHFSSATGEWRHAAMFNFNGNRYTRIRHLDTFVRHYANGRFYWTHHNRDAIIVLDTRAMVSFSFSTVYRPSALRLPECWQRQSLAVVDAGGGKPCLVALVGTRVDVYWLQSVDDGRWCHEKRFLLPEGYHWYIMGASEGVLLLRARSSQSEETADLQYFTLDLQTWSLEWMCTTDHTIMLYHLYAKHPPPLSPPCISDGLLSSNIHQDY